MDRPRIAGLATALALAAGLGALGTLAAGPIGWRMELWHFRFGFQTLMPWAAWIGVGAAGLGLASIAIGFGTMRRGALLAALLAVAGGAVAIWIPWSWGQMRGIHPPINDITTDTERPPVFKAAAALRKGLGINSVTYGGGAVAKHQLDAYSDIAPVTTPLAPAAAYAKAITAARGMGWTITADEPGSGHIEASERSRWFGFTDDIVIRVEANAGGSVIDIRSQSRWGRSDFGVNVRRVRIYIAALRGLLGWQR